VRRVRSFRGWTWSEHAPSRADALVAFGLFAAMAAQLWLAAAPHPLVAGAAGLVVSVAVAVRRRWPFGALTWALVVMLAQIVSGARLAHSAFAAIVALAILAYGGGAYVTGLRAALAFALTVVVTTAPSWVQSRPISSTAFNALVVGVLPWLAGRLLRMREASARVQRELAEHIDGSRDAEAHAATLEERARIARELHDVIAHSVSVMVIQAGGARLVMSTDRAQAETSLRVAERVGREALAEIQRLLGLLDTTADSWALAPRLGLADVPSLVADAQATGVTTELRVEGLPAGVSPALDLCAYRIVQEALTNVLKHADARRLAVAVRWANGAVDLEVSDDGRGECEAPVNADGHGLTGMRERARMHGGTLHAGPGGQGGFIVRARLPFSAEDAA